MMIETAKSLSTRFNENVGCIKSWDWSKEWKFPVIIDNMMNLELLFEASKLSGE
jgi:unsaturated chondroitin disaccharide hydrolase